MYIAYKNMIFNIVIEITILRLVNISLQDESKLGVERPKLLKKIKHFHVHI